MADTPKSIERYTVMFPRLMYEGRISRLKAAITAYHGDPATMMTSNATRVSELKDANSLPTAKWKRLAVSAPEIAAKKEEMQKTRTRATLTVVPCVSRASGESDMARRSRPSRPSLMNMTSATAATVKARMT